MPLITAMRGECELHEIDSPLQVFPQREAHLLGGHPYQIRSYVLLPLRIDCSNQIFRKYIPCLRIEVIRKRPSQSHDVAGKVDARASLPTRIDRIASLDEVRSRSPGVKDSGYTRLEADLRRFHGEF